jgi:hypothetical protein
MRSSRSVRRRAAALAALILTWAAPAAAADPWSRARVAPDFWSTWGDGKAELAGYDLTFPRYGEPRRGTAVTIFIPEAFSKRLRVKADPGKHPDADLAPVMKLNLVQDFPTGVYDYKLMTSVFTTLSPEEGRPAGTPLKVSFSAQEWCGQAFAQLLFDKAAIRAESRSYFDGEADRSATLEYPADGMAEDALLSWARGFAGPRLAAGERREVPMLPSLTFARLRHQPLQWGRAAISRDASRSRVTVPAGTFEADVFRAAFVGGRTWTFHVERAAPHRVIRWESSDGERGQLVRSARMAYWEMNGRGKEKALAEIGLRPRGGRMP